MTTKFGNKDFDHICTQILIFSNGGGTSCFKFKRIVNYVTLIAANFATTRKLASVSK
jgi:hypothetical protein